jgi:cell division protein FtsQ
MSRASTQRRVRSAATVAAPSEDGFIAGDSPPPGPVAERAVVVPPGVGARPPFAWLWSGLKLVAGLAVVAAISVAIAWVAHGYALTTPRFAIREIRVQGNRHHDAGRITALSGVERGQNLFAIDTEGAERRLLSSSWIRRAKVGRELPGTLRIDVVEREAAAVAIVEGVPYLLATDGEPFKAVEAEDPSDLPIVTGIEARDLAIDRARAIERFGTCLEVLREYAALPMARLHEPQEVHLAPDGTIVLTIGKRGTALHLGTGPFRQRLLMAARVFGRLAAGGDPPGIVFLDNEAHPERVVVRMR